LWTSTLFPFIIRQMMWNNNVQLFSFGFAQSSFLSFSVFSCQKMETGEKQIEREWKEVGCIQLTMQSRTPLLQSQLSYPSSSIFITFLIYPLLIVSLGCGIQLRKVLISIPRERRTKARRFFILPHTKLNCVFIQT